MKRIHGMGVNKVVVTALQPLGCLPRSTFTSSFQQCNGTENELVGFHNLLLQQAVTKLNNETKGSTFAILDLYKAFMAVFKSQGKNPGLFLYFFSVYMKQLVHSKPAWRLSCLSLGYFQAMLLTVALLLLLLLFLLLPCSGSSKFGNPLKPCCTGISTEYGCGSVDANGVKKYVVCDDPETTFFWDTVHPTQEGWRAVYSSLLQEQKL